MSGKALTVFLGSLNLLELRSTLLSFFGFSQTLLEFVNATGCIDEFLLAGVKWMTFVTYANDQSALSGLGSDHIAACATNLRVDIFWMDVRSHELRVKLFTASNSIS